MTTYPVNMTLQGFLKAHRIPDSPDRLIDIGSFRFKGPLTETIDVDARVSGFYRADEEDQWIEIDLEEDGEWDLENPREELYRLHAGELSSEDEGDDDDQGAFPYEADQEDDQIDPENDEDWDTRMEDPSKTPILCEIGDTSFWDSVEKDIPLGIWAACTFGDLKPGWMLFGNNWEISTSDEQALKRACCSYYQGVEGDWKITLCINQEQIDRYRKAHYSDEPTKKETSEEERLRGPCDGVSGSSCADTLAAGSDSAPTEFGQFPTQSDPRSGMGGLSSLGSSTSGDRPSNGTIADNPEHAEASLGENAKNDRQLSLRGIEHQEFLNQGRLTCQHDTGGVDESSREIGTPILGIQLRSASSEGTTANPGIEGVCGESGSIHREGHVRESPLGEIEPHHDGSGKPEERCNVGRLDMDAANVLKRRVNSDITSHGGDPRLDEPNGESSEHVPSLGFRTNDGGIPIQRGDGSVYITESSGSGAVAKDIASDTGDSAENGSSVGGDLSVGPAERRSAQEVKTNHLTSMIDEPEMVRIWLETQNIPSIQVYAPKMLTPQQI
jgi:hypothetical protein